MKTCKIYILIIFIIAGCELDKSEVSFGNRAQFKVDGNDLSLNAEDGFYIFRSYDNPEIFMNIFRFAESGTPSLWIYLPKDLESGDKFTSQDSSFSFLITYSDFNDELYSITKDYDFMFEVTQWTGIGGEAKGIFSGIMKKKYSAVLDTIMIKDGIFEASITDQLFHE